MNLEELRWTVCQRNFNVYLDWFSLFPLIASISQFQELRERVFAFKFDAKNFYPCLLSYQHSMRLRVATFVGGMGKLWKNAQHYCRIVPRLEENRPYKVFRQFLGFLPTYRHLVSSPAFKIATGIGRIIMWTYRQSFKASVIHLWFRL